MERDYLPDRVFLAGHLRAPASRKCWLVTFLSWMRLPRHLNLVQAVYPLCVGMPALTDDDFEAAVGGET